VESSWRPATAEESFEIVRRRLFEPLDGSQFKNRDVTAELSPRTFCTFRRELSALPRTVSGWRTARNVLE
jgi:hypothetical protein